MKQIYELGQIVWAFKQQGEDYVKTSGIVRQAEINKSGYVQYQIESLVNGQTVHVLANHASMACSEEEINMKIKKYNDWSQAQKVEYEKIFGCPEFNTELISGTLVELADKRGQ